MTRITRWTSAHCECSFDLQTETQGFVDAETRPAGPVPIAVRVTCPRHAGIKDIQEHFDTVAAECRLAGKVDQELRKITELVRYQQDEEGELVPFAYKASRRPTMEFANDGTLQVQLKAAVTQTERAKIDIAIADIPGVQIQSASVEPIP